MSYTADTLKRSYQKNHSEQRKKNLLKLRESIAKMSLTEFSKEIGIQKSNLSFLENGDRDLSLFNIQAYKTYFHEKHSLDISADYLLGYTCNVYADENYQMITRISGLSDESIDTLKSLYTGNMPELLDTLNYIIGTDSYMFSRFVDAVGMYLDGEYDTPLRFDFNENGFVSIDDGASNNPIVKTQEKSVTIGRFDASLCNGEGGYHARNIPISILKEAYSFQAVQDILKFWKENKEGK